MPESGFVARTIAAAVLAWAVPAAAGAEPVLKIFDAHLHYNQEPDPYYPLERVLEVFRRHNVVGILANSRPNRGTHQLVDAGRPDLRVVPFIRPYRTRSDVQNIDLMNLAGFCRNCLSNWYQEAASASGHALSKDEAREIVYGMPYKEWQTKYQKEASAEQKAAFEKSKPHSH